MRYRLWVLCVGAEADGAGEGYRVKGRRCWSRQFELRESEPGLGPAAEYLSFVAAQMKVTKAKALNTFRRAN